VAGVQYSGAQSSASLLRERNTIDSSLGGIDAVIDQAQASLTQLTGQRELFEGMRYGPCETDTLLLGASSHALQPAWPPSVNYALPRYGDCSRSTRFGRLERRRRSLTNDFNRDDNDRGSKMPTLSVELPTPPLTWAMWVRWAAAQCQAHPTGRQISHHQQPDDGHQTKAVQRHHRAVGRDRRVLHLPAHLLAVQVSASNLQLQIDLASRRSHTSELAHRANCCGCLQHA
jgi:hypothetical protein